MPSRSSLGLVTLVSAALAGCQWEVPAGPADALVEQDAATDGLDLDAGIDAGPSCDNIFGDRETQVCLRWTCDRADRSEGTFTSAGGCDTGDNPIGRRNGLKMLNLYRFLAGLPALEEVSVAPGDGQACAVALDNGGTPPWPTNACGFNAPLVMAVAAPTRLVNLIDLFIFDNADTSMTHRRFALSNITGPVSLGSTANNACVIWRGTLAPSPSWVAWPPPGPAPAEALTAGGVSVDQRGWTLQSDSIDVRQGQVRVADHSNLAQLLPVTRNNLTSIGSAYGIRWVPDGWSTQSGHSYRVTIANLANPIVYDIDVVSCI